MTGTRPRHELAVQAMSQADDLCHLGQRAVSQAMRPDDGFCIVGGNMVRLLGLVYPTPGAIPRATLDADAAVDRVEIIAPVVERLKAHDFVQERGNLFTKQLDRERRVEINLLLANLGPRRVTTDVPGVGQVDTFSELVFAMNRLLELDMTVSLTTGEELRYTTYVPDLEGAVVLKAHAWRDRYAEKDVLDLASLLEMRGAHPDTAWGLRRAPLAATRRDTASCLHTLRTTTLARSARPRDTLSTNARLRMTALIRAHVAEV